MLLLTPEQMRVVDASAGEDGAVVLMRSAGARVAEIARQYARGGRITAFAGPGNNGGDAFVALAELAPSFECVAYAETASTPSRARAEAEITARAAGVRFEALPADDASACSAVAECGLVLDGLLGTGARLPLPAKYEPLVRAMNAATAPVLAIDVPTGVDALTGAGELAVRAHVTVTLGAAKPGLLLEPGRDCVGELWVADIGLPADTLAAQRPLFAALDDEAFLDLLPQRPADVDKRGAGAPLLIAGSQQFPGAAILCARGAARAGAGYVTIATTQNAVGAVRAHLIEQVVLALRDERSADQCIEDLLDAARHATSAGIGPGLGLDERTGAIVRGFVERVDLPIVADAGALFHFAKHLDILRGKRCVLTPHAGEFARLSGKGTVAAGKRVERLREFVDRTGVTTLLKGRTTLVYDGTTMHVNTSGNPALATAGTGDVLTGVIATLLAQGLPPVDAARAGAYWHGLAGKYCAEHRRVGVIAGDLPEALAPALPGRSTRAARVHREFQSRDRSP